MHGQKTLDGLKGGANNVRESLKRLNRTSCWGLGYHSRQEAFTEPKLTFIEPKLTKDGDATKITGNGNVFFGTFVP
ncbi:hypothetical protein BROC_02053 [Candidatus Brocadiaceae bacterium]|nr:hypothetical protein BROC_02053 [Candidatus Brocadiaceae bacterium]